MRSYTGEISYIAVGCELRNRLQNEEARITHPTTNIVEDMKIIA